jgi:hypothetical protein
MCCGRLGSDQSSIRTKSHSLSAVWAFLLVLQQPAMQPFHRSALAIEADLAPNSRRKRFEKPAVQSSKRARKPVLKISNQPKCQTLQLVTSRVICVFIAIAPLLQRRFPKLVDHSMQLIKFCNPEHNIHRGAKLQVGTLYGYRTIENPELQDEAEGTYEFTIEFPEEIALDRRWSNLLFNGAIAFGSTDDIPRFAGSFSAHTVKLNMVRQTADSVVVRDTVVRISRSVNNCLIFCMSLFETAEATPFKNYKDHWAFPEQNANEFSRRLGSLIFQQAKLSAFDDSISESHTPGTVATLSLQVMHKKVVYRDRHMRITEHNKPTYEELLEALSSISFFKPESFSKENEYRFIFELNDGKRAFPPKKKNLLLTLNPLADL